MVAWMDRKSTPPDAGAVMARLIIFKSILMKTVRTPPPEEVAQLKKRCTTHEWKQYLDELREENEEQIKVLKQDGMWKEMTKEERNFMKARALEITPQAYAIASWLAESAACLLWAVGYVSEMPAYDEEVGSEAMDKFPAESASVLIKKARLRSPEEIEKQRGIAERWHWRSLIRIQQESEPSFTFPDCTMDELLQTISAKAAMDGEIPTPVEGDFPAFDKAYRDLTVEEFSVAASIATERHRAFDWLCGFAPKQSQKQTREKEA